MDQKNFTGVVLALLIPILMPLLSSCATASVSAPVTPLPSGDPAAPTGTRAPIQPPSAFRSSTPLSTSTPTATSTPPTRGTTEPTLTPTPTEPPWDEQGLETVILELESLPDAALILPNNAASLEPIVRLHGHIEFSPNMAHAVWTSTGRYYVIDREQQSVILSYPLRPYPDATYYNFSPDGNRLAWEPGNGTVRVLDFTDEGEDLTFDGFSSECCFSPTFSPDGQLLLVGDPGVSNPEFSGATAKILLNLMDQSEVYTWYWNPQIAFSPDMKTIAIWPIMPPGVDLWNIAREEVTKTIEGFMTGAPYYEVDFSPDWHSVAFWARAGGEMYDVSTGQKRFDFIGQPFGFTPDGRTMLVVETGFLQSDCTGSVCLYDLASGSIRAVLAHESVNWTLSLSPEGHLLATVDKPIDPVTNQFGEPFIRIWDVERGTEILGDFSNRKNVTAVQFSPDGHYLLVNLYSEDTDETDFEIWAVQ
jgi:WD40 repeat protein